MTHPNPELCDVIDLYGRKFLRDYPGKLTKKQYSALYNIEHCRDGSFGYHKDECNSCGHIVITNNSCRDRHCPKCSSIASKRWVNSRLDDLLPIPYYHAVFTLPHAFNELIRYNQKIFYELLFKSAASALKQFASDPKWLGAIIGFFGILHTWGGKLWQHTHVHFIVTGGGLTATGDWKELPYKAKFLFPVKAVSKVFRGIFMAGLKKIHAKGDLEFPDTMKSLTDKVEFNKWLFHSVPREWVVYAKAPFKGPEEVIKYIGRYTHRVAISNQRIKSIENSEIKFSFKNSKKNRIWEDTKLSSYEFIRRFLMHVLPNRFHRIRHYGLFANGKCRENVKKIRDILNVNPPEVNNEDTSGIVCPKCKDGRLQTIFVHTAFGDFYIDSLGKNKEICQEPAWNTS